MSPVIFNIYFIFTFSFKFLTSLYFLAIQCQKELQMSMSRNLAWTFTTRTWEALAKHNNFIFYFTGSPSLK